MTPLLKISKSWQEKLKRCLVLYVGVILWIYQPRISAGETCGRPGRTAFSIYVPSGNKFNENDVIYYRCEKANNAILGVSERRCLRNGSWSDEIPVCSKLARIERIERLYQDDDMEEIYSVDGNISTCTEPPQYDETIWTGYLSSSTNVSAVRIAVLGMNEEDIDITVQGDDTVQKKCSIKKAGSEIVAKSIKTITLHCPAGTVGNIVHIKCSYQALRICEVVVLLPPAPSCLTPDSPLHGHGFKQISGNETLYQFRCNSGYKKWGALIVFCQADGTWSPKSPICVEIFCSAPENPVNGYVEYDTNEKGVPYNGTARYRCNDGYYLSGQSTIRCHRWDEWDSEAPKCMPNTTETSTVSKTALLTDSVMETNEETIPTFICGTFNSAENHGEWLYVNGSSSFQVLICPEGFHIEGSPAVTLCLTNGSWSYTSAVCTKAFESPWGSDWTPSLILIVAVAVGTGAAIFILCLYITFLVVKKRRQTRTNTTVFHLANTHYEDGVADKNDRRQKHYSATEGYESIIERRSKSASAFSRKPRSALPNLPLDTDPVYAQPFEPVERTKKLSNEMTNRKEDLYNAHIYAEPVHSSRTLRINTPVNVPMSSIGTNPRESAVKTNFGDISHYIPKNTENYDKQCAIYNSSESSSRNSGHLRINDKHHRYNEKTELDTLTKNIEHMELL